MTVDLSPQTVHRGAALPDYRARKPPEALAVHLCGHGPGVLVVRCHDLAVAAFAIGSAVGTRTLTLPEGLDLFAGQLVWVRWVPDDFTVPTGPGSWERELRGTIGATPAVLYAPTEEETP